MTYLPNNVTLPNADYKITQTSFYYFNNVVITTITYFIYKDFNYLGTNIAFIQ